MKLSKARAEEVKSYSCGCGQTFLQKQSFRQHSFQKHKGIFIEAYITGIVLPCFNNIVAKTGLIAKKINQITNMGLSKAQISEKQILEQNNPTKIGKKTATIKTNNKKSQSHNNKKKTSQKFISAQVLQWNQFKLIGNTTCKLGPFYCGKCKIVFSFPDQYVQHCIQVCQELNNLSSSHFISSIFDSESQIDHKQQAQISNQQYLNTDSVLFEKKSRYNNCKNPSQSSLLQGCSGLVNLFQDQQAQIEMMPICGICQKQSNPIGYKMHMTKSHSEIITQASSHVVIRRCSNNDHIIRQILMRINTIGEDNLIWKCPCKPDVQMSRQAFIKHLIQVHKGISMIYHWNKPN